MSFALPWSRLVRFVSTDGRLLRGEPILPSADFDIGLVSSSTKLTAKVLAGDDLFDVSGKTHLTEEIVTVQKLLGPLAPEDVPNLRCVGLNYKTHSEYDRCAAPARARCVARVRF